MAKTNFQVQQKVNKIWCKIEDFGLNEVDTIKHRMYCAATNPKQKYRVVEQTITEKVVK